MKEFCDVSESVEVLLKLPLGDQEQDDEINGLIIKGLKIDTLFRSAQSSDDLVEEVG